MTTGELIELLWYYDPEGTKELGLETDGSERATDIIVNAPDYADWVTLEGK